MTKEQLIELKRNPEKYKEYLKKHREDNKRYRERKNQEKLLSNKKITQVESKSKTKNQLHLEKLKQNPEKYEKHLQKKREYKKQYRAKLKENNPEKYEQIKKYKREWSRKWRQNLKENEPEKYKEYLKKQRERVFKYQKEHKNKVNAYQRARRANPETRDKIREYQRNYIKQYRCNNVNNIKQKEKWYNENIRVPRQTVYENKIKTLQNKNDNLKIQLINQKRIKKQQVNNLKKKLEYEKTMKNKYRTELSNLKKSLRK